MRKLTYVWVVLALFAGIAGCKTKGQDLQSAPSTEGVADSIKAQNDAFSASFQQADTAAFAKLYTSDGWMMPPDAPAIKGREGIRQFLQQAKKMGLDSIELNTGEIFVTGDSSAVETGNYKMYAGSQQQVDHGSYMVFWKKNEGKWRLYRDIWNSDVQADHSSSSK